MTLYPSISKEKALEAARASLQTLEGRLQSLQEDSANERETLQKSATIAEEAKRVHTSPLLTSCLLSCCLACKTHTQCGDWRLSLSYLIGVFMVIRLLAIISPYIYSGSGGRTATLDDREHSIFRKIFTGKICEGVTGCRCMQRAGNRGGYV